MAGNPLAFLFPYIKKYGAEIYVGIGLFALYKRYGNFNYTYKFVYSKNDFERKSLMEDLENFAAAKH